MASNTTQPETALDPRHAIIDEVIEGWREDLGDRWCATWGIWSRVREVYASHGALDTFRATPINEWDDLIEARLLASGAETDGKSPWSWK